MRALLALLIALPTTGLPVLQGQTDYYARRGATYATNLLRDAIFREIHVRQSVAPTLVLGASFPITPVYRAGLEATLTNSGYHSTDGVTETGLGTLRTGAALLNLEGPVWRRASWRAGVGLISYWPAEDSGIFVRGGTTRFLAGAGLDYRPPHLPDGSSWCPCAMISTDLPPTSSPPGDLPGTRACSGFRRRWAWHGPANEVSHRSADTPYSDGGTDFDLPVGSLEIQPPIRIFLNLRVVPTAPNVEQCLALTTTHELGHAIGIFAHSPVATDLMYADPTVPGPSDRDRVTAELAYHTEPTLTEGTR